MGAAVPGSCTALAPGQPPTGRTRDDPSDTEEEPLPVAWTDTRTGSKGKTARVFHTTMGSAGDLQCADLRRMVVNAAYWCLHLEKEISTERSVNCVGPYDPLPSGFDYEKFGAIPKPVSAYR
ncbi:MAG: hypothetical protein IPM29_18075 [Planctomycetes bacterium]|nr:hypothetical protein [Planctomycetota bacterium]